MKPAEPMVRWWLSPGGAVTAPLFSRDGPVEHPVTRSSSRPVRAVRRFTALLTQRGESRSAISKTPSTSSANTATSTAPATTWAVLARLNPAVMMRPSPPPPASAAMVAVATSWTAAMRTPFINSGRESGSSTRNSICEPVIPMPRAARTTSRSTSRMPT